ncbi:hypothetical protein BGZ61DRAFT_551689 [Ilyonectria robusta]|uniref:uncharacterized protein n=1 Tax=Ilyonectria robusta TaxID=1079257 RepID=UPI001E8D054A|nr:uncharacterized protein BGZ61DRAFT_551689 [Ilyonectria robusta]KAH8679223.1 hypothetical protein BGZ61DRAFT_551689 [Ilyonectria robusta]
MFSKFARSPLPQAPVDDPDPTIDSQTICSRQVKLPPGRKFTLIGGVVGSLFVLILNLSVTLASLNQPKGTGEAANGLRVLYQGSCSKASKVNVVLHLFINIFSSVLLAASNYSMQCLSAPTRADVDRAHAKKKWMDIGIPSVHNLSKIPKTRAMLWFLLLVSSVPLHLLYNSVVFSSLTSVDYNIWSVQDASSAQLWDSAKSNDGVNLTALQCIEAYATAFQTSRGALLLVTETGPEGKLGIPDYTYSSDFDGDQVAGCPIEVYEWICIHPKGESSCHAPCRSLLSGVKAHADNWKPFGHRVKYCISKPVPQVCRLNFSTTLVTFVLIANGFKAAVIAYTAFFPPQEPLFVLGDAIESFLTSPDAASRNSCLVSVDDVRRKKKKEKAGSRKWSLTKGRWARVANIRRWGISLPTYLFTLSIALFFLAWGIKVVAGPHDAASLWALGFGKPSETALITGLANLFRESHTKIIQSALIANLPQLCFSVLYFQYNGLFTGMLAAREWGDFGSRRRAIRVSSDPRGEQRSNYFLQLPYRWSIPLLLMSILVHWLLSQSVFIVAVERPQDPDEPLYTTCGYSPTAIITSICASVTMAVAVAVTGLLRLPAGIPVVSSCSLAIAAACHHPDGIPQSEAPLVPLKWGVMQTHDEEPSAGVFAHCGFSSEYVEEPKVGVEYA